MHTLLSRNIGGVKFHPLIVQIRNMNHLTRQRMRFCYRSTSLSPAWIRITKNTPKRVSAPLGRHINVNIIGIQSHSRRSHLWTIDHDRGVERDYSAHLVVVLTVVIKGRRIIVSDQGNSPIASDTVIGVRVLRTTAVRPVPCRRKRQWM